MQKENKTYDIDVWSRERAFDEPTPLTDKIPARLTSDDEELSEALRVFNEMGFRILDVNETVQGEPYCVKFRPSIGYFWLLSKEAYHDEWPTDAEIEDDPMVFSYSIKEGVLKLYDVFLQAAQDGKYFMRRTSDIDDDDIFEAAVYTLDAYTKQVAHTANIKTVCDEGGTEEKAVLIPVKTSCTV